MVNACSGSIMCLLYNASSADLDDEDEEEASQSEDLQVEPLTQVITNIDLRNGKFEWIDKDDLVKLSTTISKKSITEEALCSVFSVMGALYGIKMTEGNTVLDQKNFLIKALAAQGDTTDLLGENVNIADALLLKLIF